MKYLINFGLVIIGIIFRIEILFYIVIGLILFFNYIKVVGVK